MILDDILAARRRRLTEAKERVAPDLMARRAEEVWEARRLHRREASLFGARPGPPAMDRPASAEAPASCESFRGRLQQAREDGRFPVIAEIKRASPSLGAISGEELQVASLARAYGAGGAAAISVLTEPDFFQARPGDLSAAVAASGLPALRKDFIIDPYQVDEAIVMGASAILLIVAALSEGVLRQCRDRAVDLGMDALVEVHSERELVRALDCDATLIGVNNRDLATFETDLATTERLAGLLRKGTSRLPARCGDRFLISESGIHAPEDVRRVAEAGADAVLVGEALVKAGDPEAHVARLACAIVRAESGESACS